MFRPISCFDDPVKARWGHLLGPYDEDEGDRRRELAAAERAKERLYEYWAERGLSRPLHQTAGEQDEFLAELAEGLRGA
jgi:hypothetical protein